MCVSCDVLCGMQWIWIGDGIGTVPQSHGYILVFDIEKHFLVRAARARGEIFALYIGD